jgi:antitoxin ParD1/3/4
MNPVEEVPMASLNISLPDPMRVWVEQKVARGGYGTVSELVRELIREAQKREAQERLETLLLEGLDSGPSIETTDEYWQSLRARVAERLAKDRDPGEAT